MPDPWLDIVNDYLQRHDLGMEKPPPLTSPTAAPVPQTKPEPSPDYLSYWNQIFPKTEIQFLPSLQIAGTPPPQVATTPTAEPNVPFNIAPTGFRTDETGNQVQVVGLGTPEGAPEPEVKPEDVPILGGLATLISPEHPTAAPFIGGLAKAISDITRPTDTSVTEQPVPGLMDALNQPTPLDVGGQLLQSVTGGLTNVVGTATGLLRDAPIIGGFYRALVEAPINVLNEPLMQTGGALIAGGEILGRGISDVFGAPNIEELILGGTGKGAWVPGGGQRVQEYFQQLDKSAREAAFGENPGIQDFLAGAFNQAEPGIQTFASLFNPLNLVDILPIGYIAKARGAVRASGHLVIPEVEAFGKILKPRTVLTGDNAPLLLRALFDLPKEELVEGNLKLRTPESLGLRPPTTIEKLWPANLSKNSRALGMLGHSVDNVDRMKAQMTADDFIHYMGAVTESSKSGVVGREVYRRFPNLIGTDAQLAIQATAGFDFPAAEKAVLANRGAAIKFLDEGTKLPDKIPEIYKDATKSLLNDKSLDRAKVLDEAVKADMRYRWGKHIGETIKDKLGITDPGMLTKWMNSLRQWEGALYITLNPGTWVRNATNNGVMHLVYGVLPWNNWQQIQEAYRAIGWDPFEQARTVLKKEVTKPDAYGPLGVSVPSSIQKLIPWYETWERHARQNSYWSHFSTARAVNWRRGHWFDRMPPALEQELAKINPKLPDIVYGAIEAGFSPAQIRDNLENVFYKLKVESFLDNPSFRDEISRVARARGLDERTIRTTLMDYTRPINDAINNARRRTDIPFEQALDEEFQKLTKQAADHVETLKKNEPKGLRQAMKEAAKQKNKAAEEAAYKPVSAEDAAKMEAENPLFPDKIEPSTAQQPKIMTVQESPFWNRPMEALKAGSITKVDGYGWGRATGERPFVFVKVGDGILPFYRSAFGTGGAKKAGEWQPFFGLGKNGWVIKGTNTEIASNYGRQDIANIRRWLNENFNWPHSFDMDLTYNAQNSPLSTLGEFIPDKMLNKLMSGQEVAELPFSSNNPGDHVKQVLSKLGPDRGASQLPIKESLSPIVPDWQNQFDDRQELGIAYLGSLKKPDGTPLYDVDNIRNNWKPETLDQVLAEQNYRVPKGTEYIYGMLHYEGGMPIDEALKLPRNGENNVMQEVAKRNLNVRLANDDPFVPTLEDLRAYASGKIDNKTGKGIGTVSEGGATYDYHLARVYYNERPYGMPDYTLPTTDASGKYKRMLDESKLDDTARRNIWNTLVDHVREGNRTYGKPFTRAEFRDNYWTASKNLSREQVETSMELFDRLAATYAKIYGKTMDEAYQAAYSGLEPGRPVNRRGLLEQPLFQDDLSTLGLYSALQKATDNLPQERMTPEQLEGWLKKNQVKKKEMEWTGVDDFIAQKKASKEPITKQELQAFVRDNQVQLREVTRGTGDLETGYNTGNLVLPGGTNYREFELVMPIREFPPVGPEFKDMEEFIAKNIGNYDPQVRAEFERVTEILANEQNRVRNLQTEFTQGHFPEEKNLVVHIRANERLVDGKRMLFIEEIQSDWAASIRGWAENKAKELGLKEGTPEFKTKVSELVNTYAGTEGGPPAMPFASTYEELALKRMSRLAAEEGYDSIGWTTGVQQAERYSLGKVVDELKWRRQDYYSKDLAIYIGADSDWLAKTPDARRLDDPMVQLTGTKGGERVKLAPNNIDPYQYEIFIPLSKVPDYVGKEIAAKIASSSSAVGTFSGEELLVGGQGMKAAYDVRLVNKMNDLTKKWHGKVGESNLGGPPPRFSVYDTGDGDFAVWDEQKQIVSTLTSNYPTRGQAQEVVDAWNKQDQLGKVHSIDLTPQMKESVRRDGFPLFQNERASADFLETMDGRAIIKTVTESHDVTSVIHEVGHTILPWLPPDEMEIFERYAASQGIVLKPGQFKELHEKYYTRKLAGNSNDLKLYKATQELWATSLEKYFYDGIVPIPELKPLLTRVAEWFRQIYDYVFKGESPVTKVKLTAEMRDLYSRLLQGEKYESPTDLAKLRGPVKEPVKPQPTRLSKGAKVLIEDFKSKPEPPGQQGWTYFYDRGLKTIVGVSPDKIDEYAQQTDVVRLGTYQEMGGTQATAVAPEPVAPVEQVVPTAPETDWVEPSPELKVVIRSSLGEETGILTGTSYGDYWDVRLDRNGMVYPESLYNLTTPEGKPVRVAGTDPLYQSDDMPDVAGYDNIAGADESSRTFRDILPIIKKYVLDYALKDPLVLPPDLARELSGYITGKVNPAVGDALSAANVAGNWGISRTVLNYEARTNMDEWLTYVFPFLYWRRANATNWVKRFMERPGLLNAYVRSQQQLANMTQGEDYPARLRGKLQLPMPFMDDWMGGDLYFDPVEPFVPLKAIYGSEIERAKYTGLTQAIAGLPPTDDDITKIIRSKIKRGAVDPRQAENDIANKGGEIWESAKDEASRDVASVDNLSGLFTPHAPLQWLLAAMTQQTDAIGPLLPISRPIRMITGAAGAEGGMGINIESPVRNILRTMGLTDLPEFDPWEQYRIDRELANMVALGLATEQEAKLAMLERSGKFYIQAAQRANQAKMGGPLGFAISQFTPIQTFPTGERQLREASQRREELYRSETIRLGGNPDMPYDQRKEFLRSRGAFAEGSAISKFWDDNPGLAARSAVFQEPEERLKEWMISAIWERYHSLGYLDRRLVSEQLGDRFQEQFRNKPESGPRTYEDVELMDLIQWGQRMNALVPNVPEGQIKQADAMRYLPKETLLFATSEQSAIYQEFYTKRESKFPRAQVDKWFEELDRLKTSEDRSDYFKHNPEFEAYIKVSNFFSLEHPDIDKLIRDTGAFEGEPKTPLQRLRDVAEGQVWDKYLALDDLTKRVVKAQLGTNFSQDFVPKGSDRERASTYDLIRWALTMGATFPDIPEGYIKEWDNFDRESIKKLTLPTPQQVQRYQQFTQWFDSKFNQEELDRLDRTYGDAPFDDKPALLQQSIEAWSAFYDQNPDIQRLLEATGAKSKPKPSSSSSSYQRQAPYTVNRRPYIPRASKNLPPGADWNVVQAEIEEYFNLPENQRRGYLGEHPNVSYYFTFNPVPNYRFSYYDIIKGREQFQPFPSINQGNIQNQPPQPLPYKKAPNYG